MSDVLVYAPPRDIQNDLRQRIDGSWNRWTARARAVSSADQLPTYGEWRQSRTAGAAAVRDRALAILDAPSTVIAPQVSQQVALLDTNVSATTRIQALESELAQVRRELAEVRAAAAVCAPESNDLGSVRRLLSASDTLEVWTALMNACIRIAYLLCFTFDLDVIVNLAIRARRRGVAVCILIDREQAQTGPTRNLRPAVQKLRIHGVEVKLHTESRLHAKELVTDCGSVIGSTNWTGASQRNIERGALISLTAAALHDEEARFLELWNVGRDYDGRAEITTTPQRQPQHQRRSPETG